MAPIAPQETVTLGQAKSIVRAMAHRHSVLLLSGPGVGKSDCVYQAAAEASLPCRSLVGTQIAPEDVSGIPRIVGERSVFCPPRVLLPEVPTPFCLFLDELPACSPDVQKAFYSLLLERRLGEHPLAEGTWVVAAGNRVEDRSMVRALSSALVNRVIILHVRVDIAEWLSWAAKVNLRREIVDFIAAHPHALSRPVPDKPAPFSTPRAWASLARALDAVEKSGRINHALRLALAVGRVSAEDAERFCLTSEHRRLAAVPLQEEHFGSDLVTELHREGTQTLGQLLDSQPESPEPPNLRVRLASTVRRMASGRSADRRRDKIMAGLLVSLRDADVPDDWIATLAGRCTIELPKPLNASITLSQAQFLVRCLADTESLLLQAPPGVGKTAIIAQAAAEAGLPCRSLLGTQIAPEDVSGIPRIIGERSVFCPPRVLLPEDPQPFCLFLDELPACHADVQKAFYPILLERRLGEHALPKGSWVVAAGNRVEDRAQVRDLSAALVNRLFLLQVRVDAGEWFAWAETHNLREEVILFLRHMPEALLRPVPLEPVPFSTPRAWAMLSEALDLAEKANVLDREVRRALVFGRVSAEDAAMFCAMTDERIERLRPAAYYIDHPEELPTAEAPRWFVLNRLRRLVETGQMHEVAPTTMHRFFSSLSQEHRLTLVVDLVEPWAEVGAEDALMNLLWEVTGVKP